jgi:D-alanyl-D-alanine carboxypeptidase
MHTRILTAVGLSLALSAAPAAAAASPPGLDTGLLESKLEECAAAADHSVVAEVRDGDDEWSAAFGPRSLEPGAEDAKPTDHVRIGSSPSLTCAM